ncbi:MAG: hypothetical protein QOJ64_2235 [Acidobacteriota bacterium]|jgi:uncharacterized damage-inducible protein DinB|nr:hypothetical protein [Acidobacteriota bacterium]
MTSLNTGRPGPNEYAPYYDKYISLVVEGEILATLRGQLNETLGLLEGISETQANFRYAPDKWSIKQLVGHLIDTERIFAYRALRFARNDQLPLQGFDQDQYVSNASFDDCTLSGLASEFAHVRRSTISLLEHLDDAAWKRLGSANDSEVSVRALAHIIAGHELHHMEILRSRYLQSKTEHAASV